MPSEPWLWLAPLAFDSLAPVGPEAGHMRFRSLLREPTFHFALVAGVLFAVTAAIGNKNDRKIQIPRTVVDIAEAQIASDRGVALTAEERKAVEATVIQQEVLVREA